jgi:RNA chaperone Hfq
LKQTTFLQRPCIHVQYQPSNQYQARRMCWIRVRAQVHASGYVGGEFLGEAAMPAKKTVVENRASIRNDDSTFNGTRKLVRPHLPATERRRDPVHVEDPLTHAMIADGHGTPESSHAEAFYFQKQMQQQTEMTVVLEDGEQLNGIIQWYDKCVVKLQVGRNRVLVYKIGIKYLYKASEGHPAGSVMK